MSLAAPEEAAKRQRRTQAERSETARARLSAAAFETIAEGGLNALRIRAVAEAAGVSQGALLHHFPDKNAIVLAAIEQALHLAAKDSEHWLSAPAATPEDLLRAMLDEFRAFFFSDRFWVAMGITMEASKDTAFFPTIRAKVSELRNPVYNAWADRLAASGWSPEAAARTVRSGGAMISGAAIRKFWAEPDTVAAEVEAEWIGDRLRE